MGFRRPDGVPGYPNYPPPPGTGPEDPEVILRQVSAHTFQLLYGFEYEPAGTQDNYPVPPHDPQTSPQNKNNSSDLASIPPLLTWFIGTYGLHTKAVLFHDHYVDAEDTNMTRKQADTFFRDALRESGVRWLRRWLMWTAVSLRTSFGAVGLIAVLVHLVVLTAAAAYWLLGGGSWGPAAVLALVGFGWGLHRWPLAVFGFALVASPAALAWVARFVAWISEYIEEGILALKAKKTGEPRRFQRPRLNPSAKETGPF
jgi:hypothetical protein